MKALIWLIGAALGFRLGPDSPYLRSPATQRALSDFLPPTHPHSDSTQIGPFFGYSGLIPVKSDGSSLFYWLVERIGSSIDQDTRPLILWLQGGPGCSSLIGNLYEFGPFSIDENSQIQVRNDTWATDYHLLFIDNPFGAGFSFTRSGDYVRTEEDMASYLFIALSSLCELHPSWLNHRQLYVFGESYAGKFVPHIASYILAKQNSTACRFNLQGLGLGNAWVAPITQTQSLANYSRAAGLISSHEVRTVNSIIKDAEDSFHAGQFALANELSFRAMSTITDAAGYVNVYNVREQGYYSLEHMSSWLNSPDTKALLHIPSDLPFFYCGTLPYLAMEDDQMQSDAPLLASLLDQGLKVLIYTGQDDLVCNILGTVQYVESLDWRGKEGFKTQSAEPWEVKGERAGSIRRHAGLWQVRVNKAGHMVPKDQLQWSKELLRLFLS